MKRHGVGKLILASGNVYEGQFIDDEMTGVGVYTWKDGSKYTGEFVKGVCLLQLLVTSFSVL